VRDAAIALLEEKGWLRQVRREGTTVLILNPALVVKDT
jgi:DNA-binding GntR family transcriptional regulator